MHIFEQVVIYQFKRKHIEAFFWMAAIIALAIANPAEEGHSTLCLFKNITGEFCPGCGLGHSISWLFRGKLTTSFQCHPLGIPAVIILGLRSYQLLKNDIILKKRT